MASRVTKPSPPPSTQNARSPIAAKPAEMPPRIPTADEIRTRAYQKWEAAGRPDGNSLVFWLAAEQELKR
jgi:DUF2934 family protein